MAGGGHVGIQDQRTPGALTVQADANLGEADAATVSNCSRFDAGTFLQGGTTRAYGQLYSDVTTSPGTTFELSGSVYGDVDIAGRFKPAAVFEYYSYYYAWNSSIFGNYRQAPTARLVLPLRFDLSNAKPSLDVSGVATFDGGTIELTAEYAAKDKVYSEWLVHANGGIVVNTPPTWVTPIFVTGSPRFTDNDIFFDVTRVSVASVISAASVGDAVTLGTATRIDNAFDRLDRIAVHPRELLPHVQRQMLESAADLQSIHSYDQAKLAFDSLSGQAHASVSELLLDQALNPLRSNRDWRADANIGAISQWSTHGHDSAGFTQSDHIGASYHSRSHAGGIRVPLDNGLLAELGVGWNEGEMQFERMGGRAEIRAPFAHAQLTYRGHDGLYARGAIGHTHVDMALNRQLYLGQGSLHAARSRRGMDIASFAVEVGRDFPTARSVITPFVAIGHASLYDYGFSESGNSGFELTAISSKTSRTIATIGGRYAHDLDFGGGRWIRLDMAGRYQSSLGDIGSPDAFAFSGTPDARFSLDGMPVSNGQGWLDTRLSSPRGEGLWWSLDYSLPFAGPRSGATMMFRMQSNF